MRHNLMLGVVAQSMAETTLLAEAGGVSRSDFLEFLNDSVMGSMFTKYKTPAFVNLDYTPTFTLAPPPQGFRAGARDRQAPRCPAPDCSTRAPDRHGRHWPRIRGPGLLLDALLAGRRHQGRARSRKQGNLRRSQLKTLALHEPLGPAVSRPGLQMLVQVIEDAGDGRLRHVVDLVLPIRAPQGVNVAV